MDDCLGPVFAVAGREPGAGPTEVPARLPLAFGSLCARLAPFHFEIKAEVNADDPCESPAARQSCLNVL